MRLRILALLLPVVILAGCRGERDEHTEKHPWKSESNGLRASVDKIQWESEGTLQARYWLSWTGAPSNWILDAHKTGVGIRFRDSSGAEVYDDQSGWIDVDPDFAERRSKAMGSVLVFKVPPKAVCVSFELGASDLITPWIPIPKR